MDKIARIRQKIKELRELLEGHNYYLDNSEQALGYGLALDDIGQLLDTLEAEERPEPYIPVYDEEYLTEKQRLFKEHHGEVDTDKMLAECRGYDEEKEEPDKGLEEAAELENLALLWASKRKSDYPPVIDAEGCEHEQYDFTDLTESFIAGWKCRDDQMPMPEDTVIFQKGVAEGRRLMMEEAVEGTVNQDGILKLSNGEAIDVCPSLDKCALGLQLGKKVKLIIVKDHDTE